MTNKENEDILPIVYSMLNFKKDEIDEITDGPDEDTDSIFTNSSSGTLITGDGDNVYSGNDAAQQDERG